MNDDTFIKFSILYEYYYTSFGAIWFHRWLVDLLKHKQLKMNQLNAKKVVEGQCK